MLSVAYILLNTILKGEFPLACLNVCSYNLVYLTSCGISHYTDDVWNEPKAKQRPIEHFK
jgi:hypothetical protein